MAQVRMISEQGDPITFSAGVRADGTYTVESVPVGVYTVIVALPGAVTVSVFGVAVLPEAILGLGPVRLVPQPADDLDADGLPDDEDDDRDNDGCINGVDAAPDDPTRCADTDGDGIDDLLDDDDDNDTLTDAEEDSPGVDGTITDPRRADSDDDGFRDDVDLCPVVPSSINDPAFCTDASPIGPAPEITGFQPVAAQVGEPSRSSAATSSRVRSRGWPSATGPWPSRRGRREQPTDLGRGAAGSPNRPPHGVQPRPGGDLDCDLHRASTA